MVKVGAILHDEKFNQQIAFEAAFVFSSYDKRYILVVFKEIVVNWKLWRLSMMKMIWV